MHEKFISNLNGSNENQNDATEDADRNQYEGSGVDHLHKTEEKKNNQGGNHHCRAWHHQTHSVIL